MVQSSLARIDLPKLSIQEISVTLYVRVDTARFDALPDVDSEAGRVLGYDAIYSRRKQVMQMSAAVYRHMSDPDRFLVDYLVQQIEDDQPRRSRQEFEGPPLEDFLTTVIEIEGSAGATEYLMEKDGYSARRLPFVFPILQDASTMYPMAPSHPPIDEITGLMGVKHTAAEGEDPKGYTIAISKLRDAVQVVVGYQLEMEDLALDLGESAVETSTSILQSIGLLAPTKQGERL